MRLALTVVSPTARQMADVVVDADPGTPVAGLAAELERFMFGGRAPGQLGAVGGARVLQFPASRVQGSLAMSSPAAYAQPLAIPLYVHHQLVAPHLSLAESPIRDGSVISLGSPEGGMIPEPTGLVEIRVIGGPGVGSIHRLGVGEADIGGAGATAVRIPDPGLPEYALRIGVDARGGCQVTAYEGVRATLDREPLTAAAQWRPGQQIAVGGSMLGLAPYEPPDAALHPSSDGGGIDFNRPPRLLPPERTTRFQLPAPPAESDRRPIPLLMAVVPLLMGVGMAYFLHQIYLLAMAGLTPVMLLGSYLSERKQGRKSHGQRLAEYREHKARIERDAAEALETERIARRDECPDPATVLSIASGPRRRLWERRRSNPDYLLLRVGTADLPSAVELTDPEQDEHRREVFWQIPDAPVTVPLSQRGVLGVAGRVTRRARSGAGSSPSSPPCTAPTTCRSAC